MNQIIITGNLGRDAECRFTQGGMAVLNLSVAVNDRVKKHGEWTDETTWFRCALFGKRAEGLNELGLTKGTKVLVRGRVKLNQYEKRDGTMGASLEVMADDVELLGGGAGGGRRQQQSGGYDAPPPSGPGDYGSQGDFPPDDFGDDDRLPF